MVQISLKEFRRKLIKNSNILKEREAKYGGNAPVELLNQIEDHEQAIVLTEQAVAGTITETEWREALKPLLIAIENRFTHSDELKGVTIGNIDDGIYHSIIAGRDVNIEVETYVGEVLSYELTEPIREYMANSSFVNLFL